MKVIAKSFVGDIYNEDKFNYGDEWFLLLDGATSLNKKLISEYPTNAIWLVEMISSFIENNIDKYANTKELLVDMGKYILLEFSKLNVEYDEQIEPSAGMILVREFENNIEITTLGDCTTLVTFYEKESELIQDFKLKKLDDLAKNEMIKIAKEKNISNKEAREYVTSTLLENRKKKNKEDGYGVISVFNMNLALAITNIYNKGEIDKIYVFSDGVSDYYETLDLAKNYKEFEEILKKEDIDYIVTNIRKRENSDKEYNKYPRFKCSDDATIGVISF